MISPTRVCMGTHVQYFIHAYAIHTCIGTCMHTLYIYALTRAKTNLVEFKHSFERTNKPSSAVQVIRIYCNSIQKCALISKVASTFGGIVAHVSSAIDTSKSVPVIEKIVEDNEKSDIESIFAGTHWQ